MRRPSRKNLGFASDLEAALAYPRSFGYVAHNHRHFAHDEEDVATFQPILELLNKSVFRITVPVATTRRGSPRGIIIDTFVFTVFFPNTNSFTGVALRCDATCSGVSQARAPEGQTVAHIGPN